MITCEEMLDVIKEVFDVSNVQKKGREFVVSVSCWGVPLLVHVTSKGWRVTTAFYPGKPVDGFEYDVVLWAKIAIWEELSRRY